MQLFEQGKNTEETLLCFNPILQTVYPELGKCNVENDEDCLKTIACLKNAIE